MASKNYTYEKPLPKADNHIAVASYTINAGQDAEKDSAITINLTLSGLNANIVRYKDAIAACHDDLKDTLQIALPECEVTLPSAGEFSEVRNSGMAAAYETVVHSNKITITLPAGIKPAEIAERLASTLGAVGFDLAENRRKQEHQAEVKEFRARNPRFLQALQDIQNSNNPDKEAAIIDAMVQHIQYVPKLSR